MNNSPSDLLQQLRDIHEPAIPPWWPPTIGWWIVLLLVGVVIGVLTRFLWLYRMHSAPYKQLRSRASQLLLSVDTQREKNEHLINNINLLYKYLLIELENRNDAVKAYGNEWLDILQERFDETDFTKGPGRCLGSIRFQNVDYYDAGLIELVDRTLCRVQPLRTGIFTRD